MPVYRKISTNQADTKVRKLDIVVGIVVGKNSFCQNGDSRRNLVRLHKIVTLVYIHFPYQM